MEFGKVAPEELASIDFTLPPDAELTKSVLKAAKTNNEPVQVHVGCAKWGRKEWVGQIYPPKTKDANFLDEYVKHFDCIELNATFYNAYPPETIAKWKDKAAINPQFKFCPKFTQSISHIKRLKNAEDITTSFYQSMLAFGEKLGPLFLQLSDNFTPKSFPELKAYLEHLPKDIPVFVELRHKEWFANQENRDKVFQLMHDLNIGSIITDASGRRDILHMTLPTPHAFIRFVGCTDKEGEYDLDKARLDEWVLRIKDWKQQGLKSVCFFMHQHDERFSPILSDYVTNELNKALGTNLLRPQFIDQQSSLF